MSYLHSATCLGVAGSGVKLISWEPLTSCPMKSFAEHPVRKYGTLGRPVGEVPAIRSQSVASHRIGKAISLNWFVPQTTPTRASSEDRLTWLSVGL